MMMGKWDYSKPREYVNKVVSLHEIVLNVYEYLMIRLMYTHTNQQ